MTSRGISVIGRIAMARSKTSAALQRDFEGTVAARGCPAST